MHPNNNKTPGASAFKGAAGTLRSSLTLYRTPAVAAGVCRRETKVNSPLNGQRQQLPKFARKVQPGPPP
jgi:hypothetical protein